MNPHYLWLTDALQLLTFFAIGPLLALAIAYAAWRGKPEGWTTQQFGRICVLSGATAVALFVFADWINADVRTPLYFFQLVCVLTSGLSFGVCMGYGAGVLLGIWKWHRATRLRDSN